MSIPMYYGGIDRIYGDISIEAADKILDLIEDFEELYEAVMDSRENTSEGEIKCQKSM